MHFYEQSPCFNRVQKESCRFSPLPRPVKRRRKEKRLISLREKVLIRRKTPQNNIFLKSLRKGYPSTDTASLTHLAREQSGPALTFDKRHSKERKGRRQKKKGPEPQRGKAAKPPSPREAPAPINHRFVFVQSVFVLSVFVQSVFSRPAFVRSA